MTTVKDDEHIKGIKDGVIEQNNNDDLSTAVRTALSYEFLRY